MRFKKGDKVWMVGKHRHGLTVPSMRGTVIGINDYHYDPPKMMVELENGDKVIQDIDESDDCVAAFKPNYMLVEATQTVAMLAITGAKILAVGSYFA